MSVRPSARSSDCPALGIYVRSLVHSTSGSQSVVHLCVPRSVGLSQQTSFSNWSSGYLLVEHSHLHCRLADTNKSWNICTQLKLFTKCNSLTIALNFQFTLRVICTPAGFCTAVCVISTSCLDRS